VEGDLLPFWAIGGLVDRNILYARSDHGQTNDLSGRPDHLATETMLVDVLRGALTEISAPDDLFERLGL